MEYSDFSHKIENQLDIDAEELQMKLARRTDGG